MTRTATHSNPSAYVRYVVLPQLDTLVPMVSHGRFPASPELRWRANEYAEKMFASYGRLVFDDDPSRWAEEARDQGVEYYRVLS